MYFGETLSASINTANRLSFCSIDSVLSAAWIVTKIDTSSLVHFSPQINREFEMTKKLVKSIDK